MGRKSGGWGEEWLWHFQASEVPEDRAENAIMRTGCHRVVVEVWEMKTLSEAVGQKTVA